MKKLSSFLLICLFLGGISLAQFEAGSLFLGSTTTVGTGIYNSLLEGNSNTAGISFITSFSKSDDQTGDKDKSTSLNLAPKMGYCVIDGLVIGLDLPLWYYKEKMGDNEYSVSTLSAGPFARYYLGAGPVIPFLEGKVVFGQAKTKSTFSGTTTEDKTGIRSYSAGLGAAFVITESVSVDAMLGYKSLITKDKDDNPSNRRNITNSFGITFGFTFVL